MSIRSFLSGSKSSSFSDDDFHTPKRLNISSNAVKRPHQGSNSHKNIKRQKLSTSQKIFNYVTQPFQSVFSYFTGSTEIMEEEVFETPGSDKSRKAKFNFPTHSPVIDLTSEPDEEDDDDIQEISVVTAVSTKAASPFPSVMVLQEDDEEDEGEEDEGEEDEGEVVIDDEEETKKDDDDDIKVVGEVLVTPRSQLQKEREEQYAMMQEVIALSTSKGATSPSESDSLSIPSYHGSRSSSPRPDDSISRQPTPKGYYAEKKRGLDHWNRNTNFKKFSKSKPYITRMNQVLRALQNDGSNYSSIQLPALELYKARLAEKEKKPVVRRVLNYPEQRQFSREYVARAKRNLRNITTSSLPVNNQNNGCKDLEVEKTQSSTSSRPQSPSPSLTSSSSSSRFADELSSRLKQLCSIEQLSSDAKKTYEKYKKEALSRQKLECELNTKMHFSCVSRDFSRSEFEGKLRETAEICGLRLPKPKPPVKDEFPELSEDAIETIRKAWSPGSDNTVFCEDFDVKITGKDLKTLSKLNWLNDEIINFYTQLICQRAKEDESLPKCYAFNTFFYANISKKGYASVKRWTRKVDIFSFDLLIVPVHMNNNHWCMAIIDLAEKKIDYYDSLHGRNQLCLDNLRDYLDSESKDKKKVPFDISGWSFNIRDDIPSQHNGSDCGMFALKFAEFASRRREIVFGQEQMPYFRRRMVYEIVTKTLL